MDCPLPRDAFRIRIITIFENGFAVKTDSQNGFLL